MQKKNLFTVNMRFVDIAPQLGNQFLGILSKKLLGKLETGVFMQNISP